MRIGLVLLGLLAATARAESLEELRRTASVRAAEELVELAQWCHGRRLYHSRDDAYALALLYDADQETARSKLRYVRREGAWVQVRPPAETKDHDESALPEFDRRRRAIGGRYAEVVIEQLERGWRASPPETRARVFEEILRLDPDHERTRRARGEIRRDDRWVLRETPRAAKRRTELDRMAQTALRETPPAKRDALTDEEKAFGVLWTEVLQGRDWRLLTAGPAAEASRCAQVADASRTLLAEALGIRFGTVPGMRLLVTTNKEQYLKVLRNHPATDEQTLKFDGTLSGCWLKESRTCSLFDNTEARRFEGCARQPVGFHLWGRFGLSGKQGWLWEGVGLYFTYRLTGERLSYFTRKTRYANTAVAVRGLDEKMRDPKSDWFKLAAELEPPDWELLLAKDVNQLTNAELVWSYVLAGFVLEAYPHKAGTILAAIGKGRASSEVLPEELGMSLRMLAERVPRWAAER
jgi:hypothetical protein